MRLAGPALLRARAAVAAEDDQAAVVVDHHLAQRVDRSAATAAWREGRRVIAFAAGAVERRAALVAVDGPRAGVDDQPAALGDIGDCAGADPADSRARRASLSNWYQQAFLLAR